MNQDFLSNALRRDEPEAVKTSVCESTIQSTINSVTTQDLLNKLQNIQLLLQQQLIRDAAQTQSSHQQSLNELSYQTSFNPHRHHHSAPIPNILINTSPQQTANNQKLSTLISQFNLLQNQSNPISKSSNNADVIFSAPGSTQVTPFQLDQFQLMKFLDYQRRKALQQQTIRSENERQTQIANTVQIERVNRMEPHRECMNFIFSKWCIIKN